MTGSSDEERYSRFRGERQGLTVVVDNTRPREEERLGRSRHREDREGGRRDQSHSLTVVVDNDRSCTQDQRSRPRQRENWDGSWGHRGALAERRRQVRREQREQESYRPYPSQNLTGSRRGGRGSKAREGEPSAGARGIDRTEIRREEEFSREEEHGREVGVRVRGEDAESTIVRGLMWVLHVGRDCPPMSSRWFRWEQKLFQLQVGRREYPRLHRCDEYMLMNPVRSSEHHSVNSEDLEELYHPMSRCRGTLNVNQCG